MAQRKRELIEPTPGDKRYVRRDQGGRFESRVSSSRFQLRGGIGSLCAEGRCIAIDGGVRHGREPALWRLLQSCEGRDGGRNRDAGI